jgi:phospholipid/cholesterol/gamma-HCH transport system substrate-binding protein
MNTSKSTEIKVGIVSIVAIVLLLVGIMLGKQLNVTTDSQTIFIRFPNSGGILVSSPIHINGVRRGKVISVDNDKGSVLIKADIDNIKDLKSDAIAKIMMQEITGGKKIEIFPGNEQAKFDKSKEMLGITTSDVSDLVAFAGDVTDDLAVLVRRLDTTVAGVNKVIGDDESIEHLKHTIANADELSTNLNNFVKDNQADLESAIRDLSDLSSKLKTIVDKNDPKIDKLVADIDATLKNTNELIGTTKTTITNADAFIADLKSISSEIKSGEGLVSKLIYDEEFSRKLDSTMVNLDSLLYKINQHGINVNVRLGTRP